MRWQHASFTHDSENEIRIDGIPRIAESPPRIAEAHPCNALLHPEPPSILYAPRNLPFDSVLVRRGSLNDLKFRMCGEYLIMHAADPMAPGAHFPVRHGEQIFAERRTERLKYLLRCIERDTAHQ
jgi:hypothetical protein